jgi:sec-independent protein translocase protein TatA
LTQLRLLKPARWGYLTCKQLRAMRRIWENYIMLNTIGLPGILLIAIVVLVLFGRGKISSLMGEVGKGITSFKKGIREGQKELEEDVASEDDLKDVTPDAVVVDADKDKA